MGCHTWFKVPLGVTKEEIIKKAKDYLDSDDSSWMHESTKIMYRFAVDKELCEPCCNLAYPEYLNIDWIIYIDPTDLALLKYNEQHGTNYDSRYSKVKTDKGDVYISDFANLESYSNEPRIQGYPDKIVRSYDEMLEFMKIGFTNEEGKHYNFYYDESRYDYFMNGIKTFFEKHTDGIIYFE